MSGRHQTLAAAQQLLQARRAALRQRREKAGATLANGDPAPSPHPTKEALSESPGLAATLESLPAHLGWGSATATSVIRATLKRHQGRNTAPALLRCAPTKAEPVDSSSSPVESASETVALSPSLGLAILRRKEAANGRLWLLLRALDREGRGVLELEQVRAVFCSEGSPWRFCTRRRLRMILSAGNGRFWQLDGQRIWLRSAARLARTLGETRFSGRSVAIPVQALTGGIGAVRAHLYAAFHSGRAPAPVSRQTLRRKSGVAPRTQRQYDRVCHVRRRANFACGAPLQSSEAQEQAWTHGPASFAWRAGSLRRGETEGRYLAWQLPNSYEGPHTRLGRGRQKRQNKALADLLPLGTAGNGQSLGDVSCRRYFQHARAAAARFGRSGHSLYWRSAQPGVWHCLWQATRAEQGMAQDGD